MHFGKFFLKVKNIPFSLLNRVTFLLRKVDVGEHLTVYGRLFVRGVGAITIGNHVVITSCRETNPIGGDTKTILYTKGEGKIYIGDYVGISNSSIVANKEIVIEDHVLIGGNCKIYDHDFHSLNYEERIKERDNGVKKSPVHINAGAFIGAHSIILKGVTIGKKSIVGAGSVVTRSIPDGEIWAGNPARFIRRVEKE